MNIVFVGDAHLKGLDDPEQEAFCRFLEGLDNTDVLVMLGDIFEFWTGIKDVVFYHYLPVLFSLQRLASRGVRIIFVEGNHDFSMGPFFTELLGAEVYPEPTEVLLDGRRFLLGHGDTVDKSIGYTLWRGFLRSFLFRGLVNLLPPHIVWKTARYLSKRSRNYSKRGFFIESRLRSFARRRQGGMDVVVFGHSHVAGIHKEELSDNKIFCYANPGSWAGNRSYLIYRDGDMSLESFEVEEDEK